jgi:hypothetical protein
VTQPLNLYTVISWFLSQNLAFFSNLSTWGRYTPAGAFEEAERRAWEMSRRVHKALEGHPGRELLSEVRLEGWHFSPRYCCA